MSAQVKRLRLLVETKLRENSGDTLVETLTALLIAVLAATLLATMVMSSVEVSSRSSQALSGAYQAESTMQVDETVFRPAVEMSIKEGAESPVQGSRMIQVYRSPDGSFMRYELLESGDAEEPQ